MSSIDIAIIINSFNRLTLLKKCLETLSLWMPDTSLKSRCIAIIFDAGSSDGSREWLQGEEASRLNIPICLIVPNPGDDTSFAAGINAGVAYAEKKLPDLKYLLFYETDNQILKSEPLLQALHQFEKKSHLAACGFTVHTQAGLKAGVGMPFPNLLNFFLGRNLVQRFQLEAVRYKWQKDNAGIEFSKVDVVFTSPLLVSINAWKESGGLDADVFPFSDCDVDWARRLLNLGWEMGVIRSDSVIHDNLETLSEWSKSRAVQFHRGRLRYFKRHKPITFFIVWPTLLLLRHLFELLAVTLTVKEPSRRNHLFTQFFNLLKSCPRSYESI